MISEERKLKPCPFCGGEAAQTAHLTYSWFAPVCKSCGARGPSVRIEQGTSSQKMRELLNEADAKWNTRAIEAECRVPEGYVPVPVEPSDSQLDVAVSFALNVRICSDYNWSAYMRDVYARMLAAAPKPEKAEPDVPFPGMQEAFEAHYSQSFTDRDWRREAGVWAAAWKAATRYAECQKAEPVEHKLKSEPMLSEPVAQEPVAFMNSQGKPVSADWVKHHARECEQDEYTTPLYLAPTDQSAEVDAAWEIIAERDAEVRRLKTTPANKREDLHCVINDLAEQVREREQRIEELERQRNRLVTALQAETGKLVACEKRQAVLVEALEEARDEVVGWAAYASEYFQQKHNLRGYVEKLDTTLASVKGNAEVSR